MSESVSGMQSSRQELCLQCEKMVAPSAALAIEVRDENDNVVGVRGTYALYEQY
jgi:hypothetical protein